MPDQLVNVRYMVDDVENAVDFYTTHSLCGAGRTRRLTASPPALWA
jgi:hypothetical protein